MPRVEEGLSLTHHRSLGSLEHHRSLGARGVESSPEFEHIGVRGFDFNAQSESLAGDIFFPMSSGFEDNGENVWAKPSVDNFFGHHEIKTRTGISLTRFKQINAKFVLSFVDPLKKNESDP